MIRARFTLQARDTVRFPALAANPIRGALGTWLSEQVFRPPAPEGAPSGFATPPPPFVLRTAHLNAKRFDSGKNFAIHAHVFDPEPATLRSLAQAMRVLSTAGVGLARGRAYLQDVEHEELVLPLSLPRECDEIGVEFQTPTELKGHDSRTQAPAFETLFARARDRVSLLLQLYQDAKLEVDFRGLGERASRVQLTGGSIQWNDAERTSTRTGQTHPLSGFTGTARYHGALTEFAPWLEAAAECGVGRHTVWGFGTIAVTCSAKS